MENANKCIGNLKTGMPLSKFFFNKIKLNIQSFSLEQKIVNMMPFQYYFRRGLLKIIYKPNEQTTFVCYSIIS